MESSLQFVPFASTIDHGFWFNFSKKKLDEYKLKTDPIPLQGYFNAGTAPGLPASFNLDYSAFDNQSQTPPRSVPVAGTLINFNLTDDLKHCDKNDLIKSYGNDIWKDIKSGKAMENPRCLNRFLVISYADLKKFQFYYWFSFPAITFTDQNCVLQKTSSLSLVFTPEQIEMLQKSFDDLPEDQKSHFIVKTNENNAVSCHVLKDLAKLNKSDDRLIVAFCDPSSNPSHPGWPLRNLLSLLCYQSVSKDAVEVLCFRDRFKEGKRITEDSLLLHVKLPQFQSTDDMKVQFVGWEKNERNKFGPRSVNLSKSMDPTKIAQSAVDLNLKLMRWRVLPALDLDLVKNTKCLLLGSGTLGCNIARCLLGWGVQNITLVDNSNVSYSNPVRQSLFVFEDSLNGGKHKAEAAAQSLQLIYPGVNSVAVKLSIPMPGHPVSESILSQTKEDIEKLETLIDQHDVVFLLMDTRESRWLPTLICSAKKKIVINAALGFDTYLVMRHGLKTDEQIPQVDGKQIHGSDLGCYFCNDVVAPANSTRDRTLDQACTVTRPGTSMIASALATELLMSLLQHPMKGGACAETTIKEEEMNEDNLSILGAIPHQIRGFISRFSQVIPATSAFDKCTACSQTIRDKYVNEGFDFLLKVFNEPDYLEEVSGLGQLQQESFSAEIWELSD